jgi:hypothetical protein
MLLVLFVAAAVVGLLLPGQVRGQGQQALVLSLAGLQ